jgi:GNAT superfamily N-acetyltransferase
MNSMHLVRYRAEYFEPMLALDRSAIIGFEIGIDQKDEEADLRSIEQVYLHNGGEFLIGLIEREVIAMGGFQYLSKNSAELRRIRIRRDFQGQGYGSRLLKELESRAFRSGIRKLLTNHAVFMVKSCYKVGKTQMARCQMENDLFAGSQVEPFTYHRGGQWFESSTAHHSVRYVEPCPCSEILSQVISVESMSLKLHPR